MPNPAGRWSVMADLIFISETGMFHSAVQIKIGFASQWYGFKPKKHRSPKGPGMVDTSDRSSFINHSVTFDIGDTVLMSAIASTASEYQNKEYFLGVCDCVSFSADVARQCNLRVPAVNLTPYGLIQALSRLNKFKVKT